MIEIIILTLAILGWFLYDNTLKQRALQAKQEQIARDIRDAMLEIQAQCEVDVFLADLHDEMMIDAGMPSMVGKSSFHK